MKKYINESPYLYDKVMRNETLVKQGDLVLLDKEISKFGWNLVDELMEEGKVDTSHIADGMSLYFVQLIKHLNLHAIISKDEVLYNLNFKGMESESDLFAEIGVRPEHYDNHMSRK